MEEDLDEEKATEDPSPEVKEYAPGFAEEL